MGKRTKAQDRDKYYRLAKDQGYRARSAYKLIEINKRHDFLSKAKVVVDLCAAPGGWCQVAQKTMPSGSIVLGVDLLPIRPIRGVKTLIGDITTDTTAAAIRRELQGWKADAVLCDGAPNIGTSFGKDAYVQNEIALAALKVATQHLRAGGTFVTKIYRSTDYNAFIWAVKHFFESHHTVKPASSRMQSAEIFIVGEGYLAPKKIDPRILDPRHVYVENDDAAAGKKGITIFHKKFDQHNKRSRHGYDDDLGMILERKGTASDFMASEDPIRLLTDLNVIEFSTPECQEYAALPITTEEVRIACQDLRVLSKADFKALLKWRLKAREAIKPAGEVDDESGNDDEEEGRSRGETVEVDSDEEVQKEIRELRVRQLAEKRRLRKKEREKASKLQKRIAMGMAGGSTETQEDMDLFTLSSIKGSKDDLDYIVDRAKAIESDSEEEGGRSGDDNTDEEEERDYNEMLGEDLDAAYEEYLARGKGSVQKVGKDRLKKRSKMQKDAAAANVIMEDAALYDGDHQRYIEMIAAEASSDSEDDSADVDDGNDEDNSEEGISNREAPAARRPKQRKQLPGAGLISDLNDDAEPNSASVKTHLWFSQEIFEGVSNHGDTDGEEETDGPGAADVIASMPKSDKETRKEKRKKLMERKERKDMRHREPELEVVRENRRHIGEEGSSESTSNLAHRKLIKAGMGKARGDYDKEERDSQVQIVSKASALAASIRGGSSQLPRIDDRTYGSDEEYYDDEDKARHLSMGAMMLKRHRKKEFIDASYNRYAFNDPKGLPEWFTHDEEKHHRPQVPIAPELLAKMREKFVSLASKPIKKVAEARARKRKRASLKLKAATKQAEALASNPDMSEREKLRIVKKALSKGGGADKPSKVYVVAKKFQGGKPSKSGAPKGAKVKFVDSRMRSDVRGEKRAEKRKAKRGGGRSKKRR